MLADDAGKSRDESVKLVEQWNSGTQEYPDRSCLHDMFRESATKNRDATAIVYKVGLLDCWAACAFVLSLVSCASVICISV